MPRQAGLAITKGIENVVFYINVYRTFGVLLAFVAIGLVTGGGVMLDKGTDGGGAVLTIGLVFVFIVIMFRIIYWRARSQIKSSGKSLQQILTASIS